MDQFEYVMVLVSIIVGLGIAHLLLGLGGIVDRIVDRRQPLRLSIAYLAWHAQVFVWLLLFWWWEFRFAEFVDQWTIGLYFFLVFYATTLFLMCAVMVPRTWDGVDDLGVYFVERRIWFYALLFVANALDIVDTYLKGGFENVLGQPWVTHLVWVVLAATCVVGARTKSHRLHAAMGVAVLLFQVVSGFSVLPLLGF